MEPALPQGTAPRGGRQDCALAGIDFEPDPRPGATKNRAVGREGSCCREAGSVPEPKAMASATSAPRAPEVPGARARTSPEPGGVGAGEEKSG